MNADPDANVSAPELSGVYVTPLVALLSIRGHSGIHIHELQPGRPLVVGRAAPADVVIEDAGVSRVHARFVFSGGQLWVEDLGARNGTLREGRRLTTDSPALVYPGDELVLGAAIASFDVSPLASARTGVLVPNEVDAFMWAEAERAEQTGTSVGVLTMRTLSGPKASTLVERIRAALRPLDRLSLLPDGRVRVICPGCDLGRAEHLGHALNAQVAPYVLGIGVALAKRAADADAALHASWIACGRTGVSQSTVIAGRLRRRRIRRLWSSSLDHLTRWRRTATEQTQAMDSTLAQERALLSAAMTLCAGDEIRAAAFLRVPPPTLTAKLQGWWVGATGPRIAPR